MNRRATHTDGARWLRPERRWAALCAVLLAIGHCGAVASTVVRSLPATFTPDVAFTVTNAVSPDDSVVVYAVEDTVPTGWTVTNVSDDGSFVAATNAVEWGPFFDSMPRSLTYEIIPPESATTAVMFSGVGVFNLSRNVPITGQSTVIPSVSSLSTIVCAMQATFVPGVPFGVTDTAAPATNVTAYAVEDILPAGWTATNISADGVFDTATGAVQWGPFFDSLGRVLSYNAEPPANATAIATFTGSGDFGGSDVPITGQRQISPVLSSPGTAIRSLPSTFTPGQWLTVTCAVTPAGNVTVFAVQDQPPAGWLVTNITADGTFDASNDVVEWGPFFNNTAVTFSYSVLPPVDSGGTNDFSGSALFNGQTVPIAGESDTVATPIFYGSVESSLPTNYSDGVPFTVTDLATPATNTMAYAVQDTPPPGWPVSEISNDGTFDTNVGMVQWGPFFDALPRSLTYQVAPPAGATGTVTFTGEASFDENMVPILGQRQTTVPPVFLGNVVSSLPPNYVASEGFPVTDLASPATNISVYAVQDTLPSGWSATNINNDGTFDTNGGTVQWGPFFDNLQRALSYTAVPPALASGPAVFTGTALFNSTSIPIAGQRQTIPGSAQGQPQPLVLIHMTLINGQFQFDFTNNTGLSVTPYATTNLSLPLSQWQALGAPQPLGGGVFQFNDATATNYTRRFYRLQ
jgi:hypothetical protein